MALILITGGTGLLGRYLLRTQPQKEFEGMALSPLHQIHTPTRQEMDVSKQPEVLSTLFKIKPDVIIHCAANGDVDNVESNSAEAVKSDLLGTINLIEWCEMTGCKLVTISSNAVYDGDHPPYDEQSQRKPINFYGKIKSLADDLVMKSKCKWIIIRPILLYGWSDRRDNWVTKIINSKNDLKLVDDTKTQPTYASHLAEEIWKMIDNDLAWGEDFNIGGEDKTSIYKFGLKVKEMFKLKINIYPVKSDFFESIAPRPKDTTFKVGHLPGIHQGLKEMRSEN